MGRADLKWPPYRPTYRLTDRPPYRQRHIATTQREVESRLHPALCPGSIRRKRGRHRSTRARTAKHRRVTTPRNTESTRASHGPPITYVHSDRYVIRGAPRRKNPPLPVHTPPQSRPIGQHLPACTAAPPSSTPSPSITSTADPPAVTTPPAPRTSAAPQQVSCSSGPATAERSSRRGVSQLGTRTVMSYRARGALSVATGSSPRMASCDSPQAASCRPLAHRQRSAGTSGIARCADFVAVRLN